MFELKWLLIYLIVIFILLYPEFGKILKERIEVLGFGVPRYMILATLE